MGWRGWDVESSPKSNSPHPTDNQWARSFLYGGRGAPWRNSTVNSDNHLEINWSSDQHHLNCFQCCLSSVPGLDGSHMPKANSQNCGSSCHGYSLVIMSLTFSTWWGFQSLQDSSQDMAQNIVHRPRGGTKGPGLCLVTKIVLFGLLWLSSFVSASSHFSDWTYSLAEVSPQMTSGGWGWNREDHRVLLHFKSVLNKYHINDRNGRGLQAPEDQGSD